MELFRLGPSANDFHNFRRCVFESDALDLALRPGRWSGSVDNQRLCPVLRVMIALRARVPREPLAVLLGAWLLVGTGG